MLTVSSRKWIYCLAGLAVLGGYGDSIADRSQLEKGEALRIAGKGREAVEAFREYLIGSPKNVRALVQMGAALEDQGKWKEAATVYRRVLDISPQDRSAERNLDHLISSRIINTPLKDADPLRVFLVQRALLAAKQEQFDKALNALRLLRGLFPRQPAWLFYSALVLEQQGEYAQAAVVYDKVLESVPDYAPAWVNSIISLIRSGDRDAALKQTRKALKVLKNHRRLKYLARMLQK